LRYVVIGAGAVGGAIGTALLSAGRSVTFVARGPHLEAMRSRGLTVLTPAGRATRAVDAVASPEEVSLTPEDVLVLTVKSQDTEDALRTWCDTPVRGPSGVVGEAATALPLVCAQNGLANERAAQRLFDAVLGACVWVPCQVAEPGVLVLPGAAAIGAVDVGALPGGVDAVSATLAADLSDGGIVGRAVDDVTRLKHYKLLANVRNIVTALFPAEIAWAEVGREAEAEARRVFDAAGVDLSAMGGEIARVAPLTRLGPVEGDRYTGNSTVQSLAAGARFLETDYINGEVVLLGRIHGVATPVNRALQRLGSRAVRTGATPRSYGRDELDEELRRGLWSADGPFTAAGTSGPPSSG
jgi:2-dehydropantoate 2-reductase